MSRGRGKVTLDMASARALALSSLSALGYSFEAATTISDHLLDAAMCGYEFAGLPRILRIAERVAQHGLGEPMDYQRITGVSTKIDGGGQVGYLAVKAGTDEAISLASKNGFGVVGVSNSYFSGRNAYYLEQIARAQLIGIHPASAPKRVVPHGGRSPALGTNPIGFSFPRDTDPFVFDMGTAAIMHGDVHLHARTGSPLPENVAVDENGEPTTDAEAVLAGVGGILPFGGHKGYGLSLSIQALGILTGATKVAGPNRLYGFLLIALDPELLMPAHEFKSELERLLSATREVTPTVAGQQVRIPSERASESRRLAAGNGIAVSREIVDELEGLASAGAPPSTRSSV